MTKKHDLTINSYPQMISRRGFTIQLAAKPGLLDGCGPSKILLRAVFTALLVLVAVAACATSSPSLTATIEPTATLFVVTTSVACRPEPTATAIPSPTPTPTQTPTPTLTPSPTPTPTPLPASALLEPMNYQAQTLNNCGPASIAILLGYYDHWITQHKVNEQVPPGPSPCDIVDYMPQYQLMARAYECPPSRDPTRQLLANGIPVIANQQLEIGSDIGHYRVIRGYDDASREFISDDPLQRKGPGFRIAYDTFSRLSDHGAVIAVYPPEMDALAQSLMGDLGMSEIVYCPP